MKKLLLIVFAALTLGLGSFASTPPDEGMWLPIFVERLNYVDMQEMGLQLTAEEIYSINSSSIKDAIVGLSRGSTPSGFFCTAEVVSEEGLLFTNHHCGFSYIQEHSSIENDYLADGFWAMSKEEELANPGLSATFFRSMANITDSIIPFLSDTMTEAERSGKVKEITSRLKKRASEDGKYHVVTKGFFGGNEYYLFVYEVYTDVRLVGCPPSSVGKFGGDTDNWMWPRHTGDFCIFRVYTAPDGSSAEYSEENIPMKPKHHLPVSIAGYDKGDFSMIWGYPGSTQRYLTSYGVEFNMNYLYPSLINIFGKKLEIWKKYMDKDRKTKIQYASKYAGASNTWKYMIGQERGLKRLKVIDKKQDIEKGFRKWADSNTETKEKYGDVLNNYEETYKAMGGDYEKFLYTVLSGLNGPEILGYAQGFGQLYDLLEKKTNEAIVEETVAEMREAAKNHFKDYNEKLDQDVMAGLFKLYYEKVEEDFIPEQFKEMLDKNKGDFKALAEYVFEKSVFSNMEKVNEFLDKPKAKTIEKDPAYILAGSFMQKMMEARGAYQQAQSNMSKYDRLFIAGLREMNPDKVYYPDANSTMRLSYGMVLDYYPADAVYYNYFTTLRGVMEKEDPNNDEFIVDEKLKKLYQEKDYGKYGEKINGEKRLITCFLTTHDITGGNSGSPVMNGNGELIGIAFDGNWEAMSGDIAFEPELQRTISVDIRYVLFIIDKFAGAQNLIDELTIVDKKVKPAAEMVEVSEEVEEPETAQ